MWTELSLSKPTLSNLVATGHVFQHVDFSTWNVASLN